MKKIKYFIILLLCFIGTTPILALEKSNDLTQPKETENKFHMEIDDNVDLEKNILGSSLLLGDKVSINNDIDGVAVIAGSNVEYNSMSEYGVIAGSNVEIDGIFEKDVLIAGSVIELSSETTIGRDGFIYGTDIIISGNIERDLVIYGSNVTLKNVTINGNVRISATTILIDESTIINGTLKHNETAEIEIKEATINNIVKFEEDDYTPTFLDTMWSNAISYCSLLLIFVVIFFLAPKTIKKLNNKVNKFDATTPFVYCGKGALLALLIPIIFVFLLISSIGLPLGIILLGIYFLIFYLTPLATGYVLGYIIWNKFIKKEENILLIGFIGMVIMYILSIIPVVNSLVSLISSLIGFALIFDIIKEREK